MEFVSAEWWSYCFRWLHVLSGIMWIGHLYYFNFTQTPTVPKIPAELRPAIPRFIMPEALWWFRWGAMATIVLGLLVALMQHELGDTIIIGIGSHSTRLAALGIGMWLGTIMWANVWFIIWPNQQKVLGMVEASAEVRTRSARVAGLASRTNTLLSIPMVYCMLSIHYYG
jgi:uncharacterized membrane protein